MIQVGVSRTLPIDVECMALNLVMEGYQGMALYSIVLVMIHLG